MLVVEENVTETFDCLHQDCVGGREEGREGGREGGNEIHVYGSDIN